MRQTIRIYDDGGRSADRYTAIDMSRPEHTGMRGGQLYAAVAFNAEPFHPQGFGQHCCSLPGRHLGKRIALEDLPVNARRFVEQFERENEPVIAPDMAMNLPFGGDS